MEEQVSSGSDRVSTPLTSPTDEEAYAAVVAAVTVLLSGTPVVEVVPAPDPTAWRFSARWWVGNRTKEKRATLDRW